MSNYDPEYDRQRLSGQLLRIWELMIDGKYRTLRQISDITGDPEPSVSARLRALRKPDHGGFQINKRFNHPTQRGKWEYQVLPGTKEIPRQIDWCTGEFING